MEIKAALVVFAYLLGSVPTGLILARKYARVDIRSQGSGNIGATNVARVVGKKAGVLTLLADALKGALPVWAALAAEGSGNADLSWTAAACGLAAFAGHLFPLYLGFRGGKGVATGLGVLVAAAPQVLVVCVAAFLLGVLITKYVSVGSIAAALVMPAACFWLQGSGPLFWLGLAMGGLVVAKHHGNITRLMNGTESRWNQARRNA